MDRRRVWRIIRSNNFFLFWIFLYTKIWEKQTISDKFAKSINRNISILGLVLVLVKHHLDIADQHEMVIRYTTKSTWNHRQSISDDFISVFFYQRNRIYIEKKFYWKELYIYHKKLILKIINFDFLPSHTVVIYQTIICTSLHCTYCTVLYYIVLYCVGNVLYCTVLYCTCWQCTGARKEEFTT